ncbi:hypothetical protein [Entomospira culicis]|uniref:Uncharacterized protein n=1 Tax=Entomospira culicis TaxID=2719989 RepID=A0A968GJQ8_9SPIO|nr:hypothetical protein [Entomospira culicis]NIZ19999.1 hypothetical protein [Entomospira culicis]NIZ70199.1 hypothetical protein [Entomospira culicis]WDI38094.1 hypothetical protein PVA46_08255 [Entomospira culicis]WDI39716.1 hypothetical protein PVA47_08255 [Entomospira culicis]
MSGKELAEGLGIGLAPLIFMFSIGYVGFWLSYAGLKTKDKLAKIALFGMPFYLLVLVFGWTNSTLVMKITILLLGLILSLFLSLLWKNWLRHFLAKTFYNNNILNDDGYDTVIDELVSRTDIEIKMILVELLDGRILIGNLKPEYQQRNIKSGTIDNDGNIRLVVDCIIPQSDPDIEPIDQETIASYFDEQCNEEITTYIVSIIPQKEIKLMKFYIKY